MNVASGNAITGTYNLTMESVGTSSIADPIATSTGTLTKTGAGTLTLSAPTPSVVTSPSQPVL
jgi:hypothetical protein